MKVWRIGSNWGNENVIDVFKVNSIAFASDADKHKEKIRVGDIIGITNGQPIVAVGKVVGFIDLKEIDAEYEEKYDDISAIKLEPVFFEADHEVDFGSYEGQGKQFHEAHGSYRDNIINLFNRLNSIGMNNKIRELLEFKKQIILQGPPGTGKTFTAELIASEMTKQKASEDTVAIIDEYFKSHIRPTKEALDKREELALLLKEFQDNFPLEDIRNLSLDRYAFGKGDNSTFCWWIEYGLYNLGAYTGSAGKFKIYWKKATQEYSKSGFIKDETNDISAMKKIAEQLDNVVHERNLIQASEKLSNGFILKLLNSYYPEKYFPINNEVCIDNALMLLGVNAQDDNVFQKNKMVQQAFLEKKGQFNADVTNVEFMYFLFQTFNMKEKIKLIDKKVINTGEYKIIQFHPAYSYEDFVRGITTQISNDQQISYEVENRVLMEFAQKAIDNPSSNFVLIIDEINRANLPAVLGELIYALEYRYNPDNIKGTTVESMYAIKTEGEDVIKSRELALPRNLFIIGTMNTADRSVGHIDYAIRRRFAFVDILPSEAIIEEVVKSPDVKKMAIALFRKVSGLFYEKVSTDDASIVYLQSDFKANEVQLGHSYFLADSEEQLKLKLEYEIKPLLFEYVKDGILDQRALSMIKML